MNTPTRALHRSLTADLQAINAHYRRAIRDVQEAGLDGPETPFVPVAADTLAVILDYASVGAMLLDHLVDKVRAGVPSTHTTDAPPASVVHTDRDDSTTTAQPDHGSS